MEMMRNPNAMRQAMRSQDLAMSQLENLPGGFNALRSMFENIQEPMMEAAQNPQAQQGSSQGTTSAPPTAPVNSALPNPWGGSGAQPAMPTGLGSDPFGGFGAAGGNPFGGMRGGMGGMGGMNPAQAMAMMQNPMMQQMMQQMMANPAVLDQVRCWGARCSGWRRLGGLTVRRVCV